MAKAKKTYDNESISMLKGADRVRQRPAVIFGSDGLDGCEHAIFEILSNSIDEAREGHGDKIIINRYADHAIEVEDFGRGIPVDFNQAEQRYNWELVFCEMYAGGKYDNLSGDSYQFSLGLNGLGLCATQYASEYMDVCIYRDGYRYTLSFREGEIAGELHREKTERKQTGTRIKWRPDLKVFTDINVPLEYYQQTIKRQAVVNKGIHFILNDIGPNGKQSYEFYYPNGIVDYIAELSQGRELIAPVQYWQTERSGRDREDRPEYKFKVEVAVCFSNQINGIEYYHNSSFLEHGGSPDKAVRSAFVSKIDAYLKQTDKYQKNESRILFSDVQDCLLLISNGFSSQTSYENQTKKAINNKFIQTAMTEFLRHQLDVYFIENPADAERIAAQVLINKRSREDAEKSRVATKKKLSGTINITNRVQKFVDCRTRDVSRRELYIVEGDSALGSCKQGRDAEFQAIMPVLGKILNCLKSDLAKIFQSEIITDLLKVMGCGVEVKSKANKDLSSFDLSALRWSKIIICTDADVDGFQIRTLILTMLYCLTPTLIEEGRVYIAESPLYEITVPGRKEEKSYFAYDEKEKTQILSKLEGKKYTLQRSKGLGENEPDMMWQTTMNPETRRLIKITPDDAKLTAEMFDLLLGDNLSGRKDYISDNGWKYLDLIDVV